jgi:hypothetical protein
MENPFAEMLKGLINTNGRKLAFGEQCAAYGALKLQVPLEAVARAFGVGLPTLSYLRHAGEVRGGQLRYRLVAREFEALGEDAFVQKYLTPPIRERLAVAIDAFKRKIRNPDINAKGYNPRADGYVGHHALKPRSEYQAETWEIDIALFSGGERPGYFYRIGKPYPTAKWNGNPERQDGGFVTSTDCYRSARDYLSPKD